jgi:hypothetical protein
LRRLCASGGGGGGGVGSKESECEKEGGKDTNKGRCESRYGGKECIDSNEPSASKVSLVKKKRPPGH